MYEDMRKEDRADLSEGTLSYTAKENKVKEIDVAIKVDGLYGLDRKM